MLIRRRGTTETVSAAAQSVADYVDPLAKDEKLRQKLVAALIAGLAARERARRQVGLFGLARRLGSDPVLRAQLLEMTAQLKAAQQRASKARNHRVRNAVLFVAGAGMVAAAVWPLKNRIASAVRERRDEGTQSGVPPTEAVAQQA